MWTVFSTVDHFLITTNAIIKNNSALVMGAGIAKQARDRYPGLDMAIGKAIQEQALNGQPYGILLGRKIGAFQVKHHYRDQADLALIELSACELAAMAQASPEKTFALNYPGVGNGKLQQDAVAPLLECLPDNVQIWEFAG